MRRALLTLCCVSLSLGPLSSAPAAGIVLHDSGLEFPDGTFQDTAAPERMLPLSVYGHVSGGAAYDSFAGVKFDEDLDGRLEVTFLVPPDHDPADDVFVDILVWEDTFAACSTRWLTQGIAFRPDDVAFLVNWTLPGESDPDAIVDLPSGRDVHSFTFTLDPLDDPDQPGAALSFVLRRDANDPNDTCGWFKLVAAQVR